MPSGKLFKYRCKELLCGLIVRSDKWLKHCKDKHKVKVFRGLEINKSIIEAKEWDTERKSWIWNKFDANKVESGSSTSANGSSFHLHATDANASNSAVPIHKQEESNPIPATSISDSDDRTPTDKTADISDTEVENSTRITASVFSVPNVNETTILNQKYKSENENKDNFDTLKLAEHYSHAAVIGHSDFMDSDKVVNQENEEQCQSTKSSFQLVDDSMVTANNNLDIADYSAQKLTSQTINLLLKNKDSMSLGDKFMNAGWRYRCSPSGKELRKWLVYSPKKNSIFCFTCVIFGIPGDLRSANDKKFAIDGYGFHKDWHNTSRDVEKHESIPYHHQSEMAFIQWISPLRKHRIDDGLIIQENYIVQHHRQVLSVVIDCCRYLCSEMLALRNSDSTKGKLVRLFTAFSKYNPDAKQYLQTLENTRKDPTKTRMRVNFLAYQSILNLIITMKKMVLDNICDRIKKAGKYSIISDSTQDVSKMETVILIARYVEEIEKDGISTMKPVERTLGAFTTGVTTGAELSKKCLSILEDCGLNKKNVIGQSYDGASNMSGSLHGMQNLIQAECPSAAYIWCYAHRFALVVEKSLQNCVPLQNYFGLLEELYVFMSGHRRHSIFVDCLTNSQTKDCGHRPIHFNRKRLKRVWTTRWSSKSAANSTVNDCYEETLNCLRIIENDKTMGKESITKAAGLRKQMATFNFIAIMKICTEIFAVLSPVTNILQGIQIDLGAAALIISDATDRLKSLRQENVFNKIIESVQEMCSNFDIPIVHSKRLCIRKRFYDEMNIDIETSFNQFQDLKINVFFVIIDELLAAMNERFHENTVQLFKEADIFTHQRLIRKKNVKAEDIKQLCRLYEIDPAEVAKETNEFQTIYEVMEKNIDITDLMPQSISKKLAPIQNAESEEEYEGEDDVADKESEVYTKWVKRGFVKPFRLISELSSFSNLRALLKILVTLPVTSCTAERNFSKHKLIKNYLRSVMLDPYMSSMLILAIESDITDSLKNDNIIDRFARISSVYSKLLIPR